MSEDTPPDSVAACGDSSGAARRASRRNRSTGSGSEALNRPASGASGAARVAQPVVQPVGAALPEFDRQRHDAVAAPVRRARRVVGIALAYALHGGLERTAGGHRLALRRRPGGEAGAERAAGVIRVRGGGGHLVDGAVDAHLALEVGPLEYEAGGRARRELAALAAAVVGEEDEAAVLDALQKHDPGRGRALGV